MSLFAKGDAVLRREDRPERRATVTAVDEAGPLGPIYEIAYAEGGSGWWPEEAIEVSEEG